MIELSDAQRERLQAAYAEPPRAYHAWSHVGEVARHYEAVAEGPGWGQPREVALAVLYHDAVYDPARRDNEARSADFALQEIARWMPDGGIDASRVGQLILWTARHGQFAPDDFNDDPCPDDVRHFLDCDMAILGASPDAFDAYDRAIAREYRGHVPGWLFRINRRRFLKGLLARDRIFLSEFFHERFNAAARANLRRAVTRKQ
ncbi:hypothetical protein H4F99_03745 [Lysobacter sp. SG-8]|uniref:Metal-dependent HD superfamily phosphohydrolase n=1 Tax=Marilutibacter penaei TaxID=2759900 RepID=A0A7W3U2A5_9GAMM|nr:hypothetical protein [Lysobacter penaei]